MKDLEIRGLAETVQTIASLRLARILRRVLEIWGDSRGKPSANASGKNRQKSIIIEIIITMAVPVDHRVKKKGKKRKWKQR